MDSSRIEQCCEESLLVVSGFEHHVGHDVSQHQPHPMAALVSVCAGGMRQISGRQNIECNGGEPAKPNDPMKARDGRVLGAVDADGENCGPGALGDERCTIIDFHQGAGYGDASLRKNHRFPILPKKVGE